jgi:hypothetical protein
MQKREFRNRIRSLFNIDGHLLPELSSQQQLEFLRAPVTYFLESDETQSDAIMREIERRQNSAIASSSSKLTAPAHVHPAMARSAKPTRASKVKPKVEGQREMLLPIPGGKSPDRKALIDPASPPRASEREGREIVSVRRTR